MKDDLRYTPTVCFESFPFPEDWESNSHLAETGSKYYDYRAELMVRNDEGMTPTYNRFHDPGETSPDIHKLRELHAAMDRAVLDAYGWTDVPTDCEFIPDFTEEDDDGNEIPKNIRYRWPDEVRDDVLARLLALNAERHAAEVNAGLHANGTQAAKKNTAAKKAAKKAGKKAATTIVNLSMESADLPGIDPWEQRIDTLTPTIPSDMRFPLGSSTDYYRFLLRALIQEAGGRISYRLLHTATKQIQDRTNLNHYWSKGNPELYASWERSFNEDASVTGYLMAEEQLFATSGQARLTGSSPESFEARLTPNCPAVTDSWFILDARLLLKSALSADRSGNAEQIEPEKSTQLTAWVTYA